MFGVCLYSRLSSVPTSVPVVKRRQVDSDSRRTPGNGRLRWSSYELVGAAAALSLTAADDIQTPCSNTVLQNGHRLVPTDNMFVRVQLLMDSDRCHFELGVTQNLSLGGAQIQVGGAARQTDCTVE